MKKTLILLYLLLFPVFSNAQHLDHQTLQSVKELRKKLNNAHSANDSKMKVLRLEASKVTDIEIYRDENMTSTGYAFHININKKSVVRHAGEWHHRIDGVTDTYEEFGSTYFTNAIDAINKTHLLLSADNKPVNSPKGTTQIIISQGDKKKYNLIVSPEHTNVKGDFYELVDLLLALTGGEPEFGDPIGPDPITDDELY